MFQTVHYHIRTSKLKSPVTIGMLADLHNYTYGTDNRLLLDEIEHIFPDFICIAGDMLVGHSREPFEVGQKTVVELAKNYPVYYGLGNHESRMLHDTEIYGNRYEEYMGPIKDAGAKVLVNDKAKIQAGKNLFCIYGYDLPRKYFKKFNRYEFLPEQLEEALGKCETSKECYHILLAHNPIYFKQYAKWGADLTLSGHLHGGIIRLPLLGGVITPQAKLFPRYSAGLYQEGDHKMVVSRGLGTHTIPIRFNNRPELSVIHLAPA